MPTELAPSLISSFTPEPGLPWLHHDPTMQHREAFTNTLRLRLRADYSLMAPHFPGGTEVLATRVSGPADLVLGAVYYLHETGRGTTGWHINPEQDMGRLLAVNRVREHRTHPFAELELRYDTQHPDSMRYQDEQGRFRWMGHFNGYRGSHLAAEYPDYRFNLWRLTHYINPPLEEDLFAAYLPVSGMSLAQQRWYTEEQQLLQAGPELVTAYSTGLDYAPTLEHLLDAVQARLLDEFLASVPTLPRSRAQKRKSPVVALTRRTHASTSTLFYAQEAIVLALDMLDSLRRAQASRDALTWHVAQQRVRRDVAQERAGRTLALAA